MKPVWYVLKVKSGTEKRTSALLSGVEGVLEVCEGTIATSGYVAVLAEPASAQAGYLRRVPGVAGIVGETASLPAGFTTAFVPEAAGPRVLEGAGVKIASGAFAGIFGSVQEVKRDGRIVVSANVLGRETLVELDEDVLEVL